MKVILLNLMGCLFLRKACPGLQLLSPIKFESSTLLCPYFLFMHTIYTFLFMVVGYLLNSSFYSNNSSALLTTNPPSHSVLKNYILCDLAFLLKSSIELVQPVCIAHIMKKMREKSRKW